MLLVRHAACPEHGELIHADGQDAAKLGAHAHSLDARPVVAESAPPTSHDHDHCFVLSERRESAAPAAREAALAPAAYAVRAERCAQAHLTARSSLVLYLLAPKNSPPA